MLKSAFFFSTNVIICLLILTNIASGDTFGTGDNQFTIDFVNISGATNPTIGYGIVNNDYRIGKYEITNDQWNKFVNINGTPTGNPSNAYDSSAYFSGTNVPTNRLSWYEAAQFVNWLNTSTGYQVAYKFTEGTYGVWESGDAGYNSDNPYRNSNAHYFMPTEDEWVKAGYWNGTSLQTYASVGDVRPTQSGWNFYDNYVFATDPRGPWDVGSGSEELNGTFDMMGNVWEWMESSFSESSGFRPLVRGGSYSDLRGFITLRSSYWTSIYAPSDEMSSVGFRVASVPEPTTLILLSLGAVMVRRKRS